MEQETEIPKMDAVKQMNECLTSLRTKINLLRVIPKYYTVAENLDTDIKKMNGLLEKAVAQRWGELITNIADKKEVEYDIATGNSSIRILMKVVTN